MNFQSKKIGFIFKMKHTSGRCRGRKLSGHAWETGGYGFSKWWGSVFYFMNNIVFENLKGKTYV